MDPILHARVNACTDDHDIVHIVHKLIARY